MSRTMTGTVVSNKMDKTVVITVGRIKNHPIYKKQYKATARFQAHDEANTCNVGDVVEVVETRPISAKKRFTVTKVITAATVKSEVAESDSKPTATKKSAKTESVS